MGSSSDDEAEAQAAIAAEVSSSAPAAWHRGRTSGADAVEVLFAPQGSVQERFPGLDGLLLQQAIWRAYVVLPTKPLAPFACCVCFAASCV